MRALALALAFALLVPAAASAAEKVTPKGVGDVKLGASYRSLRDAGLLGKTQPGCELADPRQRIAPLRAPLKGFATLNRKRRIVNVYVTKGATARGVAVGHRLRAVRRAFPSVEVDRSTEDTFGIALATVPRGIQFAIGERSNRVQAVAVPSIPFCE
jgi:hypothetical protein